ncbi:hypothetical protein [Gimesia aquarii]|uniref:NlpC/P60 domain-containing protein n=1 Tax=Gimesia aquarii TaxID=2527964 RepID=A0A517X1I7_9PLAN|nr:hypothetical protein [Gimesia aquarii]QDU11375.1 hypothetical protein V202x_47960 [Gimesia aquarii]
MFRCCTILAGFVFAFAALNESETAQAQSIQVRFSPSSKNSSVKLLELVYYIRTDKITSTARSEQLAKEAKRYGGILDTNQCKRKQGPATEQDCVGFVTERLFWGGNLSSRNRVAELRGPGANNFYLKFMPRFCEKINGESARKKGDIVACIQHYPNGTQKCMHVAIVTDNGKILTKDGDESVFLVTGGNKSLNVPFKDHSFEYWRLKEKLRAEMLYDFSFGKKKAENTTSFLVGWEPVDSQTVQGRFYLPKEFIQVLGKNADLGVLSFIAKQKNDTFVVNDNHFTKQIQQVGDALNKATNNKNSKDKVVIDHVSFTLRGSRIKWNIEGVSKTTTTTFKDGEKKCVPARILLLL